MEPIGENIPLSKNDVKNIKKILSEKIFEDIKIHAQACFRGFSDLR